VNKALSNMMDETRIARAQAMDGRCKDDVEGLAATYVDWLLLLGLGIFLSIMWAGNLRSWMIWDGQTMIHMRWVRDHNLYQGSLIGDTFSYMYSAHFLLMGLIGLWVDPMVALHAEAFLCNCLIVLAVWALATTLFQRKAVGYVACLLVLLHKASSFALAGAGGLGAAAFPHTTSISTPILLFAITLLLKERYLLASVLVGLAFDFHGSYAAFVGFAFAVYLLTHIRQVGIRKTVQCGLAAALPVLPLFVWMALVRPPTGGRLSTDQWLALTRLRSSGHAYPFTWRELEYLRFMLVANLYLLGAIQERPNKRLRALNVLSLGIVLLCAIGLVFIEFIPIPMVIKLTVFRSTIFLVAFALIVGANYVVSLWEAGGLRRWLGAGIGLTLLFTEVKLIGVLLTLGWLEQFLRRRRWWQGIFVGLSAVFAWRAWTLSPMDWAVEWPRLAAGVVALLVQWLVERYGRRPRLRRYAPLALTAAALVVLAPLGVYERLPHRKEMIASMEDTQLWLRDYTPTDQLVLTPPNYRMWSAFSERGVFCNLVDLSNPIYVPHLGQETLRRVSEYVDDILQFPTLSTATYAVGNAYVSWPSSRFAQIAEQYNVSVAVVDRRSPLAFERVYENDLFAVYDLRRPTYRELFTSLPVPNAGFGEWDAAGQPKHWTGAHVQMEHSNLAREGSHALRAQVEVGAQYGGMVATGAGGIYDPPAEEVYQISDAPQYFVQVWIRTEEVAGMAYLYVLEFDAEGNYTQRYLGGSIRPFERYWPLRAYYLPSPDAASFRIFVNLRTSGTTSWVDGFKLARVDRLSLETTEP